MQKERDFDENNLFCFFTFSSFLAKSKIKSSIHTVLLCNRFVQSSDTTHIVTKRVYPKMSRILDSKAKNKQNTKIDNNIHHPTPFASICVLPVDKTRFFSLSPVFSIRTFLPSIVKIN